ncbi:MAG TPA: DUF6152 family protein [Bryobacteraceae bacterium]|jgi:hypothetical protein
MKAKLLAVVVGGLGLLLCTVPMMAHHSFAAEYDSAKPVTLTGTVTKVEWMNPHARFYIDVKDEKGEMNNWELELGSPNGLMRQGWTRNSLKKGDQVSITGSLAKDGSKLANARTVKLADGRQVFAGSSETENNGKGKQ